MTHINEKCVYFCGPYKAYCGRAEYDPTADLFHGEIIGTRDVVTFQGRNPAELRRAFRESVDDYLAFCQARGEKPEKPFSGKFMARLDPETHRRISQRAELSGKSLNQFVSECLESFANAPPVAHRPAKRRQPSRTAKKSSAPSKGKSRLKRA